MADQAVDYSFRLYVAGQTVRSHEAESNLRGLCESHLPGRYEFEVIDAVEHPDLAEDEQILATPTVVRRSPSPELRVIGDLSDQRRAAVCLGFPGANGTSYGDGSDGGR
jgi:circadian clock protein KaiB